MTPFLPLAPVLLDVEQKIAALAGFLAANGDDGLVVLDNRAPGKRLGIVA